MPRVPPGQLDYARCATMPASDLLAQVECAHTGNRAAGCPRTAQACADPVTNITTQIMLSGQKHQGITTHTALSLSVRETVCIIGWISVISFIIWLLYSQ